MNWSFYENISMHLQAVQPDQWLVIFDPWRTSKIILVVCERVWIESPLPRGGMVHYKSFTTCVTHPIERTLVWAHPAVLLTALIPQSHGRTRRNQRPDCLRQGILWRWQLDPLKGRRVYPRVHWLILGWNSYRLVRTRIQRSHKSVTRPRNIRHIRHLLSHLSQKL